MSRGVDIAVRNRSVSRGVDIRDANVVIFGLGLHGGGVASAKWCATHGARVTVYDRRPARALGESIDQLRGLPIAVQCGDDNPMIIRAADVVIKNPAVPRATALLQQAQRIETDLSLLLRYRLPKTIAVTGTKGKSSIVSAIDYALSRLGVAHATVGNIGIAIPSVIDRLADIELLVLELSSFQLGDLAFVAAFNERRGHTAAAPFPPTPSSDALLSWPDVAVCTNLYPDHLDYYSSMDKYAADKCVIAAHQRRHQWLILNGRREQRRYTDMMIAAGNGQVVLVADGDTDNGGAPVAHGIARAHDTATARGAARGSGVQNRIRGSVRQVGEADGRVAVVDMDGRQSRHSLQTAALGGAMEYNLSMAYAALRCAGIPTPPESTVAAHDATIPSAAPLFGRWTGIAHRMELVGESVRIRFINDSAATIPHAVWSSIVTIKAPIYLIAGGSDKGIDVGLFVDIAVAVRRLFLLAGSATTRIVPLLRRAERRYEGPFASLAEAFAALTAAVDSDGAAEAHTAMAANGDATAPDAPAKPHRQAVALLSPGCASFGMFRHEFDRGQQYRDIVAAYLARSSGQAGH